MYKILIDQYVLLENLNKPNWVIVDCSYDLTDMNAGRRAYLSSHIRGAIYADVHDDLSGTQITDQGRHPLPTEDAFDRLFSRLGVHHDSQVIVYDNACAGFAGRLWWMLRYMGHEAVAVLDGGWHAWEKAGLPTAQGEERKVSTDFQGVPHKQWLVVVDDVLASGLLVDSRDPQRYSGKSELLDKAAGHIPGAVNRFWRHNLDTNGFFKESGQLRQEFARVFGDTEPRDAVFYCGSGITACHNILAVAHAGFDAPRLYAGSWSDWCSDPGRPVVTDETG